jgi:hypothetical protein
MKKSDREKRLEYALKKVSAKLVFGASKEELQTIIWKALARPKVKRISKERWEELKKAYVKFHPRA